MPRYLLALLLSLVSLTGVGPAWAKPTKAAISARAARVRLASNLSGADLERIRVGNQAGILKIFDRDHHTVRFIKDSAESDVSGIDGVKWAPLSAVQRDAIVAALDLKSGDCASVAHNLMSHYADLPPVPALALLGALTRPGVSSALSAADSLEAVQFLEGRLKTDKDGPARRQATLALALVPTLAPHTVSCVMDFLESDHNNWDTFATVQFFDYHRTQIAALPNFSELKTQITKSGNPHAPDILYKLTAPPEEPSTP